MTTIKIDRDGDQWCALDGVDLQSGTAGFGDTPAEALRALMESYECPSQDLASQTKQGLFGKYIIQRSDGSPLDPAAKYVVLRYDEKAEDGSAARAALLTYAALLTTTHDDPDNLFAADLIKAVDEELRMSKQGSDR